MRIDLKYDLGDGVTDNNVPTLEEDSRADPVYTTSLSDCVFMTNDGQNISKVGEFLDKWVIEGTDGTISEAKPGEPLYVAVTSSTNSSRKYIIPGSKFERIDPATGEIVYTFTATPVWRSTTKLRYHMNLSPEHVYIATDQNHQSYTYPTDPANISYIIIDDENDYELNSSAVVTSNTYTAYPSYYSFVGWSVDEPLPLVKKTDTGYIDAYDNAYSESEVLKAGDSVLMDQDHMLYAVWCITNSDDFVKVTATVKNGRFITNDTYTGSVYSGCLESIGGYYTCGQASSSWVSETGTSSAFIKKDSSIDFLSVPNKNYSSYNIKYHIGNNIRSEGYEENQLPQAHYGYIGHCDHFWDSPLASASADETYYYEIEYLDINSCYINFFKNEPGNSGISTTENYSVHKLNYNTLYYLSSYYTKRDDGSIKLNGVGVYNSYWDSATSNQIETWTPAPDAEFAVDGYYFVGWAPCTYVWPDYACDETDIRESIQFISKDDEGGPYGYQNFAAVWAEIPDVIYYSDTDKATAIDTQSVIPNNEVTVGLSESVSQPTKAGYIFSGWKCVTDGVTVTDGKFTMPDNDVEFVPIWETVYTIIYEAGKTDVSNMPYASSDNKDIFTDSGFTGGKRSLSGTPTHAAYSFAGWSLDGTTAITEVTSDKFTEANSNTVTVTALWTEKIYKLVYNANSPHGQYL